MLPLYDLAEWSRQRAKGRLQTRPEKVARASKMFADIHQLFHERLIDACKRVSDNPSGVPDILFVALPERLLGKTAYLCIGDVRQPLRSGTKPPEIREETVACLRSYDEMGRQTSFANLESPGTLTHLKHVLICHGLSPIGDSILLLAELGRAYRLSRCLGLPMRVMLADISWMSSNRSIRQFESLDKDTVDNGLRVCLDKRRRLYEALEISPDLREISPYDRAKTISGQKLEKISQHYNAFAAAVWGCSSEGPLTREQVSLISASLDRAMTDPRSNIPDHMKAFAQHPRALVALESELKAHLEILRTIAKQFNSFDPDVFKYFFAQYYGQDPYRGIGLKIAPISERRFDEPFDKLDEYFRAWGEGHSTASIIPDLATKPKKTLAGAYLPQYQVGGLKFLPYTPLSLDALNLKFSGHREIIENMLSIDHPDLPVVKITEVLKRTPLVQRNRLVGDLISFVQLCVERWSVSGINAHCRALGCNDFSEFLSKFPADMSGSFEQETGLTDAASVEEMWGTWLKTIETDTAPTYTPLHMFFYLLEESDWSDEMFLNAAQIVALARLSYQSVV